MQHCDYYYSYFDVWGKGTKVTVGSTKSPTLFPLVQCSSDGSASQIAVGCLALNFFPENLTYQWSNQDSQALEQYPVIAKDDSFSRVSLIRVSKTDWDAGKSYNCSVSHNGQSKHVTLKNLREVIDSKNNFTLVCLVTSPQQLNEATIDWTESKNQDILNLKNQRPHKIDNFKVISYYTTTKERWNDNYVFECKCDSDVARESDTFAALNCIDDALEEDEVSSLWSMTSSFIFLFISTLFYSVILSLVKMKR
ncbi:Ig mu chain C region membrane-bound form [Takifugu flavidus]|uniref:Ig mu chain C region membrane-bound form n=1 Tax=Takifugu flavidus TaxID=433684 RepID=A0A5C6NR02_9TELE|nr:Ig mu chain C region membrane-bound form [Takifugu flavidus]